MVKVHGSGRLTTRNRKFLRKITPYAYEKTPSLQLSAPKSTPTQGQPDVPAAYVPSQSVPHEVGDQLADTLRPVDPVDEGVPVPAQPQVAERRSTRTRTEPDRLEVSWKGQSYEKQPAVPQDCVTARHSVNYGDCLLPAKPGGGEGIYDDGSSYNLWMGYS